jgi:hypothetical protein
VAVLGEDAANEQAAVAVGGVFLATNQGHMESGHTGLKAVNGGLETGVFSKTAIEDTPRGVIIGGIGGSATQVRAEKKISNACFLQGALHEFFVELRDVFRVRGTASVHYHLNTVLADQRKPSFGGMVGVADCVKAAHPQGLLQKNSTDGDSVFFNRGPDRCP